ncbi:DUF6261 family protein [Porphyromonas gingivalis]|uniref:DUF6261 family protein n=1 Tax=Porphyromonas gingivalis TaxID=837 RepID=UPI001F18CFF7|nr:DUF6261 family protein [Porphyromonas gingivalis]
MRAYKRLDKKSYRNETELMYKLAEELRSDKYKADVTKLAISTWVDKMDEANKAFDRIFDLQAGESDELSQIPSQPSSPSGRSDTGGNSSGEQGSQSGGL